MGKLNGFISFEYAYKAFGALVFAGFLWLANDKISSIDHRLDRIETALFIPAVNLHNSQANK